MRVDGDHGRALGYEPNSYGEWQEQPEFAEPPLRIEGSADHWNHREDNDYYSQLGKLFRVLLPAFRYRRQLLPKLALCVWKALSAFVRNDTERDTLPAAIVSIQTAGEFLNWHPNLHIQAPAGAFRTDGRFAHTPGFPARPLLGQRPGLPAQ
jgi:hypothetical protein